MAGCGVNWGHLASWLDRWRNRLGEARSERYSSISEVSRVYFARVHLGLVVVLWNFLGPGRPAPEWAHVRVPETRPF